MPHNYRVTVESLETTSSSDPKSLSFDVSNHDELFELVERVAVGGVVPEAEVAEFTIGLKLFGEIVLRHRSDAVFAEFFPHFAAFMKRLKKGA